MNETSPGNESLALGLTNSPRGGGAPPPNENGVRSFYPWYVVGVLLLINALSYLDRQVMSILISPIQADLSLTDAQIGFAIGPAFMALFVLAGLPMGRIADRHHRGRLLAAGILIWSAGTIATAEADSFWSLAIARAVVGLGEACVAPAVYSLVADYFAPDRRARAVALASIGIPIGAGAALFMGGLLLHGFGNMEQPNFPLVGPASPWSLVLLVFGVAGIVVAALALTIKEPRRAPSLGAPVAHQEGFGTFLRSEPRAITLVLLPYVLMTFLQVTMVVWMPTLLVRRHGLDHGEIGTLLGTVTLVTSISATLLGGWIADKFLSRTAAGPFALVSWLAPFFLPAILLYTLAESLTLALVGFGVALALGGVCLTTVYAAVPMIAAPGYRGRILALYVMIAQLAGIGFGPLIVGLISDHGFGDPSQLHLAVIWAVLPAWLVTVICGFVGRRHFAKLKAMALA